MFGRAWCLKGTHDIIEAAIKAPSIRVSGSLISVIRTVTIGPVDAVDRALHTRSTKPPKLHSSCFLHIITFISWRGEHTGE